ncbi:MAG: YegS/Rv2252/BmrU family lipid kinase [Hamadaea sp.]|uniref:diacylglycerol/lipid kinase family protein n=1 Tax=Hamadaea sp. TaxID=2024425 RepID=UPI0017A3E1AD|nr:YegS/Rv2252/BmrU family lipid kinase [Hamadaea sp.]NUR70731.1 YegS/Rv2252/BmrU family lipid kinase [Hamadaea sp.]NUT21403.1 YegS/Rv2252/BmrU family lipid kinase [Hamadaea sp.]
MRSKIELDAAIRRDRRAVLLVNTRSRRGRDHFEQISRHLDAAGFDLLARYGVERPERLPEILAEAIALGPDLLVAGGGDGTISETARHLAHRDVAMGLLPLGTTNNFARTLGVPLEVPGALALLTEGKVADVDLGEAAGRIFTNLVSIGLSAQVAEHVPHRLKRRLGRVAYPLTALSRLPGHRPFDAVVTAGGEVRRLRTHQLNIANGNSHAGNPIARDGSADDQLLIAYSLGRHGRRHLLGATLQHLLTGRLRTVEGWPFLAAAEVLVETSPSLPLDVDGEVLGRTPVRVRIVPNALRVMVSKDFPDR